MIPNAARAVIAAHLTDALDLHPHLATFTTSELADRLAADGWHITSTPPARPVAPRAREEGRTHRGLARRLLPRRTRTKRDPVSKPLATQPTTNAARRELAAVRAETYRDAAAIVRSTIPPLRDGDPIKAEIVVDALTYAADRIGRRARANLQ